MKDFTEEMAALLGLFDYLEEHARACNFHDSNRAIRRDLIEKYASACFQACENRNQVDLVGQLFVEFIGVRTAPGLAKYLANQSDEPVINAELEDAFVDYFARNGGYSPAFVEVLWSHVKEHGLERCAACGQNMRWHAIIALRVVTDEGLPLHHFVGEQQRRS